MFLDNDKTRKQISKWVIGIVAPCILIFLAVRYVSAIAMAVKWLFDLFLPLLIGAILALILNVPLRFIERHLFRKKPTPRKKKLRRPLAILLSILLVLSIFVGVAFLVIPELARGVVTVVSKISGELDKLALLTESIDFSAIPFGEQLQQIDIDWIELKSDLESWIKQVGSTAMDGAVSAVGSVAASLVDFFIGLIFSVYILANKEKLKRQLTRLVRVWHPEKVGNGLTHVASVFGSSFRLFIVGQTTEALILGTLCTIGMLILRLPYAPMIGALVGVMQLIPYVGAFISNIVGAFMILTESPFQALVYEIFILTLQQVEGNLIYPRVVGAKLNLPPMWVLAAITVGGNLAGPGGMLLGVPVASALYTLVKEATEKREAKMLTHAAPAEEENPLEA